jgi:hypothetical protein
MRKGLIVLLAAFMVVAFTLPAMADLTTSGWMRIKARMEQNYGGGPNGTILPMKDAPTASYVEQRQRFILDWKTENVGARFYFEIDYGRWGDNAYSVGRNLGSALEADSVNLETKNLYIWFNVPNTGIKVTAGVQSMADPYDAVLFGTADMAGIMLTGSTAPISYRLGWAQWEKSSTTLDTGVDLYIAELGFSPVKEAKLGLNFYVLRDASGEGGTVALDYNLVSNPFTRDATQYGYTVTSLTYKPSTFYYIGIDGSVKAGPVGISGWAFYNFGKIESINATGTFFSAPLVNEDVDVKGWAASLRGDMNLGPGKFFLAVGYVSGTGEDDEDYKSIITGGNYATAGSFPFYKWDMQILFPNGDDINASSALVYDAANNGRGLIAAAAGYSQKFTDMLSGKIGVGYLSDAKNTVGSSATGVSISKHKAFEVNANVNYAIVKGLDLGLYGAYAWLTDWESYVGAVAQESGGSFVDADDIFKVYARLNYSF